MSEHQLYPVLSDLLPLHKIPSELELVKEALTSILDKVYFKDLVLSKAYNGEAGYYTLSLISLKPLGVNIPFANELKLVINPSADGTITEVPLSFDYQWEVLKYFNTFSFDSFDNSIASIVRMLLEIAGISKEDLFNQILATFFEEGLALTAFLTQLNQEKGTNITAEETAGFSQITSVLYQIERSDIDFVDYVIKQYIEGDSFEKGFERVKLLFQNWYGELTSSKITEILKIKFRVSIPNLSLGLLFPRKWLIPVDANLQPLPEPEKAALSFAVGAMEYSTQSGFSFVKENSLALTRSQIGKTGLIVEFNGLKLDLSKDSNIPEATANGRGNDFQGVYAQYAAVTLPQKWFDNEDNHPGTTARLAGYDLLIGNGGISGTIALEAIQAATGTITDYYSDCFSFVYPISVTAEGVKTSINDYSELLVYMNAHQRYTFNFPLSLTEIGKETREFKDQASYAAFVRGCTTAGAPPRIIKNFGKKDGFSIWFTRFDILFQQGKIIESSIVGGLKVPRLKDGNGDRAEIEIVGHLDDEGDFLVTASEKDGFQPINIPGVLKIFIQSISVGSEDQNFFLGTQCALEFTNPIMKKLFCDSPTRILLPNMRIYADGSFEIVGGAIPIPTNFSLCLGPVTIAISGVNFGSHEREYGGQLRKYNYWGFDGAIDVDPLGVEVRGDGVKYYYTVDDGDGKPHDSYIHIKTVSVDLIIPGTAKPETATAIINGYLSIPEPGVSKEYGGGVSLKMPKARMAGSAEMRLIPKHPAFIVDAEVSIPTPIPIGSTGLVISGFRGLVGYRYVAEKEAVGLVTGKVEDTWYKYYVYPRRGINIQKFSSPEQTKRHKKPFSIGAGATIDTAEGGTILSTRVMLVLSLPSMFMIDGRASVLGKRQGLDSRREPPFFVMLTYGDNSIEAGMGADFRIPERNGKIAKLSVNIEAAFFFNHPSAWYINIGRKESPVEAKILDLVTAQAYLQLSAQGIEAGARAEFNFNKKFGPVRVKAWLYLEIGGKISFERPQIGGYIDAGGGAEVKFFGIGASISFEAILAAEAVRPYKIYAKFKVCGRVKIGFIRIKKCVEVKLKWEKSRRIDTSPIPPLLPERAEELIKAVHMLTGEAFELQKIAKTTKGNSRTFKPITIPMDSYIDVKFTKAVKPNEVRAQLGGLNNAPRGYTDKIPPIKTIKGGKSVRQVTHTYAIESLNVDIWDGSRWKTYHPYEAITTDMDSGIDPTTLKIGHWQKTGKVYDKFRLLTHNPFSFTEQGEKGWFIPEQLGITASSIFCETTRRKMKCADWKNRSLRTRFAVGTADPDFYYAQKGVFFRIDGLPYLGTDAEVKGEFAKISKEDNPHGYTRSLEIHNSNTLLLKFPNSINVVRMKLSSTAQGVHIKCYTDTYDETTGEIIYTVIPEKELYRTAAQLHDAITIESPTIGISKIEIDPQMSNKDEINRLREEIEALYEETYDENIQNGETIIHAGVPDNDNEYDRLLSELEEAKSVGCSLSIPGRKGIGVMKIEDSFAVGVNTFGHGLTVNKNGKSIPLSVQQPLAEELPIHNYTYKHNQPARLSQGYHNITVNANDWILTGFAYGGDHAGNGGGREGMCTKLDMQGTVQWSKYYYLPQNTFQWIASVDGGKGTSILVGHSYSRNSISIARIDANGDIVWQKALGYYLYTNEQQHEINIIKKDDNHFVITSKVRTHSILLTHIDGKGNIIKSKILGGNGELQIIRSYTRMDASTIGIAIWRKRTNEEAFKSTIFQVDLNTLDTDNIFEFEDADFKINDIAYVADKRWNVVGYRDTSEEILFIKDFDTAKAKTYEAIAIQRDSVKRVKSVKIVENNPNLITTSFQIIHLKETTQEELTYTTGLGDIGTLTFNPAKGVYFYTKKDGTVMGQLPEGLEYCKFNKTTATHVYQRITTRRERIGAQAHQLVALLGVQLQNASLNLQKGAVSCPQPPPPPPPPPIKKGKCFTLLHEVCWLTEEDYDFNINIPSAAAIQEDFEADVAAITKAVTPIWRPNSKYRLHFTLSDTVADKNPKNYDYYYGFQTGGPIGFFHTHPDATYGDRVVNGRKVEDSVENPDLYPLTSLRKYIDYNRSYPNANGNLLQAKPLFYGTAGGNNEIALFFTKSYLYHMFGSWKSYHGLAAQDYQLQILVKDPIEKVTFSNPPQSEEEIEAIPGTTSEWTEDLAPRVPESHLFIINMFNNQACTPSLGDAIIPRSFTHKVTITNLKPQKMYTAIVNGLHEGATVQIHDFVFQTSRYIDFKAQIHSYYLTDDAGNTKEALFYLPVQVDAATVNTAYRTVAGIPNSSSIAKETEQVDLFDRVIEGILQLPPLDAAVTTEINVLKNGDTTIGIWFRSPEPINDPKIPIDVLMGTAAGTTPTMAIISDDGTVDTSYQLLYNKDRSQCLIMKKQGADIQITATEINLRCTYLRWDGNRYQTKDTVEITNILLNA